VETVSGENLAEERFRVWLRSLPAERLRALGEDYAELALAGGLAVLKGDGDAHPIPPALTAVVDTPEKLSARADLAHRLLSGVVRTARYYLGGDGRSQADAVLEGLSPWERELCDLTWRAGEQVAIARVDLFTDDQGVDRPLELNATIPAMQAYSDVCAQAFLLAVGDLVDLSRAATDRLGRENGSNSDDLRRSLVAHHQRLGGASDKPSIAMVARAGDPQSTELSALCAHFHSAGLEAHRCTPEQLELDASGRALLLGRPIDVIYRHIFARRIDPQSPLGRIVREPEKHHLFNPVNSQLEMKSLFSELSAASTDRGLAQAIGLTEEEVAAAALIPWSRRLFPHRTQGPGEGAELELVEFVQQNPARIVLKRSWGYGGTSVLLGDEIESVAGQKRAADILGRETGGSGADIGWHELIDHCVAVGGYIVQERVALFSQRHLVAGLGDPHWADWYVDVSSYTNLGVEPRPSGSVRRGSASRIVNIVGGGGLVPVITEPVMEELLRAIGV
jgi:hypothetical protein